MSSPPHLDMDRCLRGMLTFTASAVAACRSRRRDSTVLQTHSGGRSDIGIGSTAIFTERPL